MSKESFSELTVNQLQNEINSLKLEYSSIKLSHKVNPIQNPLSIRNKRRKIARLLTELNKKKQELV